MRMNIYQMPDGEWGASYLGTISDGFSSRADAVEWMLGQLEPHVADLILFKERHQEGYEEVEAMTREVQKTNEGFLKWFRKQTLSKDREYGMAVWQACEEHYGIEPEPPDMTREGVLAMPVEELRDECAKLCGATLYFGGLYESWLFPGGWRRRRAEFCPDEDPLHLNMVIEAMRERGKLLEVGPFISGGGGYEARFTDLETLEQSVRVTLVGYHHRGEVICRAALCAVWGV